MITVQISHLGKNPGLMVKLLIFLHSANKHSSKNGKWKVRDEVPREKNLEKQMDV